MEQRLLDGSSAQERLLNEHFLRARRRTRGPLAVVGDGILLMNGAAAHVFSNADQPWLWAVASQALERHELELVPFPRADGTSCVGALQPVRDGNDVIGAIIRFRTMSADGRARTARSDRPIFGWKSLTETEHALAALVAEGLTNKEAAARLFVSRHTIDSHLRQIFRKLEIYSRVELARRVVEREICTG
jgi:DNA-binding CsgD family transcriptional regulator